jgi:hypothetical protein
MNFNLESVQSVLVATVGGCISLGAAIDALKSVSDAAADRGSDSILLDVSAVEGKLSVFQLHEIGSTLARYFLDQRRFHKVAVLGKESADLGFAAKVAWNRGLTAEWFTERRAALRWLSAHGHSLPDVDF